MRRIALLAVLAFGVVGCNDDGSVSEARKAVGLQILVDHDLTLIRLYDTGENSVNAYSDIVVAVNVGAEKHSGLFNVDRIPNQVAIAIRAASKKR